MTTRLLHSAVVLSFFAGAAPGQAKVTYDDQVRPIFVTRCLSCHNPDKSRADVDLSSYRTLMAGGSSGEIVTPGNPEGSILFGVVSHTREPNMPPKGDRIPEAELATIRAWIAGGCLEKAGGAPAKARASIVVAPPADDAKPDSAPPRLPQVCAEAVAAPVSGFDAASHPGLPVVALAAHCQVLVYATTTGDLLGSLPFPRGSPGIVRFSGDGRYLLGAGGINGEYGCVRVWSMPRGEAVATLGDELDRVLAADMRRQRDRVALGGPSRVVKVYSLADGTLLDRITKHTDWVTALSYSPDGVLLATADRAGGLLVWEAETDAAYLSLGGHASGITGVSFSADSNLLASCGEDGNVRLWEMTEGRMVKEWRAHGPGVLSIEFSRAGQILTAGRDGLCKLWDTEGKELKQFAGLGDLAIAAALDPLGGRVVATDLSGNAFAFDAESGKQSAVLDLNPPSLDSRLRTQRETLATAAAARDNAGTASAAATELASQADRAVASATAARDAAIAAVRTAEAARLEAIAGVESARAEAERLEAAAAAADAAVGAAVRGVEAALGELRARVEADGAAQTQLAAARAERAKLDDAATAARSAASQSDSPERRAAAEAAESAARAASEAVGAAEAKATESSGLVRAALDSADKAKAAAAVASEAKESATRAAREARGRHAAAVAREQAAESVVTNAVSAAQGAEATFVKAGEDSARAKAASEQAARTLGEREAERAACERRVARLEAGVLRAELDALEPKLAEQREAARPLVEASAAADVAERQAKETRTAAETELRAIPARVDALRSQLTERVAALVSASGQIPPMISARDERAADVASFTAAATALREKAARAPQDAGLAAAAAKAEEALDALRGSLGAAEAALAASLTARDTAKAEHDRVAAEITALVARSESLPAEVQRLTGAAGEAEARAVAARAAADEKSAPANATAAQIAEIGAAYEAKLAAAEGH